MPCSLATTPGCRPSGVGSGRLLSAPRCKLCHEPSLRRRRVLPQSLVRAVGAQPTALQELLQGIERAAELVAPRSSCRCSSPTSVARPDSASGCGLLLHGAAEHVLPNCVGPPSCRPPGWSTSSSATRQSVVFIPMPHGARTTPTPAIAAGTAIIEAVGRDDASAYGSIPVGAGVHTGIGSSA